MTKVPPAHRAQALGFRALSRLRGETVKYYINQTTFVEIEQAVLTRPKAKADQVGAVMILAHHWDWLIAPDALENSDGQIIPQRGHWIIRSSDGTRYDVQPHDGQKPCWRWCDGSNTNRRIHTSERT